LIFIGGKIWTENPAQPEAEAIAIVRNRIAAVGSSEAILKLAAPDTQMIDLRGRRVVPGFNDSHVHFYMGGASLASVQLRDAASPNEFRERIRQFARSRPKGEWIQGGNWDHENWTPVVLPTHNLIDDVTTEHPVFVNRSEAHMALANSLAMKLAGVDKTTTDVPGGVILRDSDGNPTGIFKDAAKGLIERLIPIPTEEQITSAILAAQSHAAENGVTSVQDMGVIGAHCSDTAAKVIRVYRKLQRRGQLHIRVAVHVPIQAHKQFVSAGLMADLGNDELRIRAVKSFADGALGSATAWFFEPYADAPDTSGIPSDELSNPDEMYRNIREANSAGFQIAVHGIGDRANKTILDFFQELEQTNGKSDRRLRIEHAQHLRREDIPRFAKLSVIASVQPYHCIDDGRWAERRIGPERAKTTYAFRSLLDSGATLAFGSDWFVAPIDPLQGIYAAVTRRSLDGKHPDGWVPEQKVSVKEAVHAYTMGSAFASKEEQIKGSLEPGKLADLVVLSDDILQIDPENIRDTKVDMTLFDGRVIFERR
jgi:predicted amidohydrolase YtcJ